MAPGPHGIVSRRRTYAFSEGFFAGWGSGPNGLAFGAVAAYTRLPLRALDGTTRGATVMRSHRGRR